MSSEFNITEKDGRIIIEGSLDLYHTSQAEKQLDTLLDKNKDIIFDLSKLEKLDTAGALLLYNYAKKDPQKIKFNNASEKQQAIFKLIDESTGAPLKKKKESPLLIHIFERLGKASIQVKNNTIELISFFGESCIALLKVCLNPAKLRFTSITHHIEHTGINAIPIVSLIAFLISIVLAYQGIAQLRPLGAEQFTVNLIAISVLREMGVLLTAIMVAGRSGSAFTAEIGVMKVREEIDAMKTIGLDPFEVLVIPRVIGLIISLPLLTFIANIMGLIGGAILSVSIIGISLTEYIEQVNKAVSFETFFVGMVKAPVFAIAIAIVGCMHGMRVSGSSESVGKETTASVVESIFLVLMLDAIFSILFEKMGI